jgi:UDPglucose 6-dehydrogenase
MRISVIGVGYVGLVSGVCFAEVGNDVLCMDIDNEKIERLRKGEIPIYEPHLEELVKNNINEGRLQFTDSIKEAVDHGLIIFVCVNTPQDQDGSADLQYVLRVASGIGQSIEKYRIIVVKSTVPVGTCEKVKDTIRAELAGRGLDVPFDIASNPEFLKEGVAVDDCMKPERVIVGVENSRVEEIVRELYSPFIRTGAPFIVMDLRSSEMTKYAANAMLATRISFMNQMANVCERVGADVMKVMRGMGSDSRIGPKFLFPGIGVGGADQDIRGLRLRVFNTLEGDGGKRATAHVLPGKDSRILPKEAAREETCGVGSGLQGKYGRRARGTGNRDLAGAHKRRCYLPRIRP